jgi:O-antigen ligase
MRKNSSEQSGEARKLMITVLLYSLAPLLVTFFVSETRPALSMVSLPIIFLTTYFLPTVNPGDLAKHVRIGLAYIYVYGTILAVILVPEWAIESGYSTETSYVVFRLYGMAAHANSLAGFLFLFIVLGWIPGARLKYEKLHIILAVILMLAAQSKTVIFILILVLLIKMSAGYLRKISRKNIISYLVVIVGCIASTMVFALQNIALLVDKIQNPEVFTLTGRLAIWLITISLWQERPWFGYGMDMWNPEMQIEYSQLLSGFLAPHAHNQFLQTLGESGLCGLVLLLFVYYSFANISLKAYSTTAGVSFFMFIYLVIRSLSEVPIVLSATQSNFFGTWRVYSILLAGYKFKAPADSSC